MVVVLAEVVAVVVVAAVGATGVAVIVVEVGPSNRRRFTRRRLYADGSFGATIPSVLLLPLLPLWLRCRTLRAGKLLAMTAVNAGGVCNKCFASVSKRVLQHPKLSQPLAHVWSTIGAQRPISPPSHLLPNSNK